MPVAVSVPLECHPPRAPNGAPRAARATSGCGTAARGLTFRAFAGSHFESKSPENEVIIPGAEKQILSTADGPKMGLSPKLLTLLTFCSGKEFLKN